MSSSATKNLEKEDHARDAAFNKAMHGSSAAAGGGISAMLRKNRSAQQAASEEYFKHWDNKDAKDETAEDRAVWFPRTASSQFRPDANSLLRPELRNMPLSRDSKSYPLPLHLSRQTRLCGSLSLSRHIGH